MNFLHGNRFVTICDHSDISDGQNTCGTRFAAVCVACVLCLTKVPVKPSATNTVTLVRARGVIKTDVEVGTAGDFVIAVIALPAVGTVTLLGNRITLLWHEYL